MRNRLGRLIKRRTAPTSPLDVLVRPSGNRDIYVVSGGAKRRIPSMDAFKALGYDLKRVRVVPAHVLAGIPDAGEGNGQAGGQNLVADPYVQFTRVTPSSPLQSAEVTDVLYSRLSDSDVDRVKSSLDESQAAALHGASVRDQKRSIISFAVHFGLTDVLGRVGLNAAIPPDDIHAMSRGVLAIAGGCLYGDLVLDAMGLDTSVLRAGAKLLDFGCSSGRVVRVLAAAYPDSEWYGCDPNQDAIRWDRENLPGMQFAVSSGDPPLAMYSDGMFDVVFAISIWSHFAENAAVRWLNEMHRLVRPGGLLIITTHGYRSIAYLAENRLHDPLTLAEIRDSLYSRGFCFAPIFGKAGDWGYVHREWGEAFLSPEWLLAHVHPAWTVTKFEIGRVENNQDIYTLQRV
jgi:SAM-dependent methyltransferase